MIGIAILPCYFPDPSTSEGNKKPNLLFAQCDQRVAGIRENPLRLHSQSEKETKRWLFYIVHLKKNGNSEHRYKMGLFI